MIIGKIMSLALLTALLLTPGVALAAYNPFGEIDCSQPQVRDSAVCESNGTSAPNEIVINAANIIAIIAAAAAVIVIVVAGIRFITGGGDPNQVAQAKKTILFAAIGLVIIGVARAVVTFVLLAL